MAAAGVGARGVGPQRPVSAQFLKTSNSLLREDVLCSWQGLDPGGPECFDVSVSSMFPSTHRSNTKQHQSEIETQKSATQKQQPPSMEKTHTRTLEMSGPPSVVFRKCAVSISTLCEYLALDVQNRKNEKSSQQKGLTTRISTLPIVKHCRYVQLAKLDIPFHW